MINGPWAAALIPSDMGRREGSLIETLPVTAPRCYLNKGRINSHLNCWGLGRVP